MGDNEVATTPNHHTPRSDDRSVTSGVRRAADGRSLVGTTGTSPTIRKGSASVARRAKHSHVTPHRKASSETIRPLSHHQSIGTSHIPTPTPRTVEHSSHVPCRSPHAI